jgi:hypothetical protein
MGGGVVMGASFEQSMRWAFFWVPMSVGSAARFWKKSPACFGLEFCGHPR